jgi:hypothetical protein
MYSHVLSIRFEVTSREKDASDVTPSMVRAALVRRLLDLGEDQRLLNAVFLVDETIEVDKAETEPPELDAIAPVARLLSAITTACGTAAGAHPGSNPDWPAAGGSLVERRRHRVTSDDLLRALPLRPAEGTPQEWAFRSGLTDGYRSAAPDDTVENLHIRAAYEHGHAVGLALRALHDCLGDDRR